MIELPLRAVTFDLDDTLWSVDDVLAAAELQLYEALCRDYPAVAERFPPPAMRRLRSELAAAEPHLARNATTLRRATLRAAARSSGLDEEAAAAFTDYAFALFIEARQCVQPYPDVAPALRWFAERFTVGVITNGNADIYRTELAPYIDFVVRGVDIDLPKPDPEIFHYACRCAGAPPGEVLHVGDDPWIDAAGALGAGLQAALICRHGLPSGGLDPLRCLVVADVAALQQTLQRHLEGAQP
ncbi:hypothetical protein CKO15_07515 [Halorhodospira abdelmalekii]|uniref:HAD family hydrolase n=1 Tax=Halorhodospira abdelmalekii TaxID=421629 RepID=UPI001907F277|nr:HAD family hydrolase [Halorhodospira abdelmalekii]MBK1735136.1 hypothetical protein [Halorhodospira abdelmalekii]